MERLTFDGNFCDISKCRETPCPYPDTGCSQKQVWERLKEYEDTGLMPEEIVPVRHGHWVGTNFDGYADGAPVYYEWECSECGEEVRAEYDGLTNYCPHCGARMDEEESNEKNL